MWLSPVIPLYSSISFRRGQNQGCPHCSYNLRHLWFLEQLRTSSLAPANFLPQKKSMEMDQNSTCRGLSLEKKLLKTNMAGWKIMKTKIGCRSTNGGCFFAILIFLGGISIYPHDAFLFMMKIRMPQLSRIHGLICLLLLVHHVHLMTLESRHEKTPFRYAGTSALSLRWYVGGIKKGIGTQ